jgi:hypothetical protein
LNEKLEKEIKMKLKEQVVKQAEEAKRRMQREHEIANEMNLYLERPDVRGVFDKNEKGLLKYFKYYCKNSKHELDLDVNYSLENMYYKEFTKFAYQTKIIPIYATADDVTSTFRNIVRYFKEKKASEQEIKLGIDAGKSSQFIDFNLFKRALVRLALIGKQQDGPQDQNID